MTKVIEFDEPPCTSLPNFKDLPLLSEPQVISSISWTSCRSLPVITFPLIEISLSRDDVDFFPVFEEKSFDEILIHLSKFYQAHQKIESFNYFILLDCSFDEENLNDGIYILSL